jgi:hypothetical protein
MRTESLTVIDVIEALEWIIGICRRMFEGIPMAKVLYKP